MYQLEYLEEQENEKYEEIIIKVVKKCFALIKKIEGGQRAQYKFIIKKI